MSDRTERDIWLQNGIDRGWISTPFCGAHDVAPFTDEEAAVAHGPDTEAADDLLDRCNLLVRIWEIP